VRDLIALAAGIPFALGIVVIAIGLARVPLAGAAAPAELAASLGLGLEFVLAAGLLRLSALDDFGALAAVAAIVLLRRVLTTGLGVAVRALGGRGTRRLRA
jgi:uncharacterized membrane protein